MAHPELAAEQAYVDHAYTCLDRMREAVERAPATGAGEVEAEALEAWAARRLVTFADAERGLCFGRIDLETTPDPLYIGRRWVHDEGQRVLVINWQAPAARPFYTATPVAPHGVTLRRRFRTEGRRLVDLSDEALHGLADGGAPVDDFLLEELGRSREARMRDIVATIQADQYGLIARDPAPPLVIQGGPGTGKTAVGLHRASFLLYSHRAELRRILVVGPNPTFMDYVSHVLPILGEDNVDQRAVAELVEGVEITRSDSPEAERLKGDVRLAEVLHRAATTRLQPRPERFEARVDGAYLRISEDEVARLVAEARTALGLGTAARERFRNSLLRLLYAHYGAKLGAGAYRAYDELERGLRRDGRLTQFLARVWPQLKPERLVSGLLGNRNQLAQVAGDILDAAEQRLLVRRAGGWSAADLALVDEARALLDAPPRSYGHVIVDEAQDLTPMQLRLVGRRMAGAFTLLGDIAQATGAHAYDSWDDLLPYLPGGDEAELAELEHAYRVPREIMAFSLPLVDEIAPGTRPPRAYRTGGDPPRLLFAEDPLGAALAEAARLGDSEGLVAVIAPAALRTGESVTSVFDETRVPVLTPREAKGLEFDHVVVVEPAAIVAEGGGRQGLRELYVALSRPTRTLVVTHALPLPTQLG